MGLSAGKPLALLTYLAVEERPVSREEVAALLWPEADGARARASVRQALWTLRQVLGPECFASDDPMILADGVVETDLASLVAALEEGDLEAADQLWKGPLLHDLEFPRAKEWHRWLDSLRTREETRFGSALLKAGVLERSRGHPVVAARWLRRAVEVQPHNPAHRVALVETLLDAHQWSEATLAISEAQAAATDPDQLALLEALEKRLEALRQGLAGVLEPQSLKTEFVGRTAEFSKLSRKWRKARTGAAQVGLVLGPPGIGKTRLAEELAAMATSEGGTSLSAKAVEVERSMDWGLASELVRGLYGLPGAAGISNRSASVLARLVPSLPGWKESLPPGIGGGGTVEPAAVTDALLDLVCAVAEESPLLLVVDDLQWVDKQSRAALSHLARAAGREPLMVLFASRTGDGDPEVAKALDSLLRLPAAEAVELGPLETSEVSELLVLLLEPIEPENLHELAGRVYAITRGNPLFIVEILKLLQAEGLLESGGGGKWRVDAACLEGPLPVPKTVELAIRKHLDDLSAPARHLAAHMAREARPVPAEELRRLSRLDPFEVSGGLQELFERDLIRRNPDGRLQFVHDAVEAAARRHLRPDGSELETGLPPGMGQRRAWHHQRPLTGVGWWRTRKGVGVAGVALLALAAVLLGMWRSGDVLPFGLGSAPAPTYPFGQGSLWVWTTEGVRWVAPPAMKGGTWTVTEAAVPFRQPALRGPVRSTDGALHWFAEASDGLETPPYVGVPLPDGEVEPLWRIDGDVGFRGISPDGRSVLLIQENLELEHYAHDLIAVDPETREARILFRAPDMISGADWSPDGQRIVLVERGGWDSLRVLAPDGSILASFGFPESSSLNAPAWCQDSDRVVFRAVVDGVGTAGLMEVSTGEYRFPSERVAGLSQLVCMGSGDGVAARALMDGVPRLVYLDLFADTIHTVPGVELLQDPPMRWVPDRVPPFIEAIRIQGGELDVRVGESARLTAQGRVSDGTAHPVPVSWLSRNPSVASVNADGLVIANHPGVTTLVARFAGWMEDSVQVTVTPSQQMDLLFRDAFSAGSLEEWELFGYPPARLAEVDGEVVLSLPGDGRYQDGVAALGTFSLRHGVTAELQYRFPLTRTDRQRFMFCLEPVGDTLAASSADWRGSPADGSLCFQHPIQENVKFDSQEAGLSFSGLGHAERFHLPPEPESSWVGVALQVRPDGAVTLFVNHSRVYEMRFPLPIPEGSLWRVRLSGASVDTSLHVRGVSVWPGQRYVTTAR